MKMKSLCGIRLLLVAFLLHIVLREGSAKPNNNLKKVFGARQSEARRNRIKYNIEANYVHFYTGFLVKTDFIELVLPTLSRDDKLKQTFKTLDNESFQLICRKDLKYKNRITQQHSALSMLKHKEQYIYGYGPFRSFVFVQTPLTIVEEKIILKEYGHRHQCLKPPIPGLQLITKGAGSFKRMFGNKTTTDIHYTYGEDNQTCVYFQLGIETLDSDVVDGKYEHVTYWTPLFNICHDVINSITVFTKHTIKSDHLKYRKLNPNIKVDPEEEKVFVGQHYDQYYDLKNQEKSFEASECQEERKEFSMESNYLVTAHLVPDHDHLYESWQYITNNYLNYVPQWRSVNMGQWLNVEQDIRFMATKLGKDVTTYTGVHYRKNACTLNIPVQEEVEQNASPSYEITVKLNPIRNPIQIPSLLYKYVHTDKAGIVIITANGVSGSLDEIKCRDVCAQYGWLYGNFDYQHRNSVSSGQTKCCIPDEFFNQKVIKHSLPSLPSGKLARTKILSFNGLELDKAYGERRQEDAEDFSEMGSAIFSGPEGSRNIVASNSQWREI